MKNISQKQRRRAKQIARFLNGIDIPEGRFDKIENYKKCWNWKKSKGNQGYGSAIFDGKIRKAHRISAVVFLGFDIDSEIQVLHHCDNPSCCNPLHFFFGTNRDNVNDKIAKNRQQKLKGEAHGRAILTEKDVILIRQRRKNGEKLINLAREYGITTTSIAYACNGKNWSHIPFQK